jgi:hypothetical protein
MLEHSVNAPQQKANAISEWVWFDGSVALKEGQGVCYEYNYESPASPANPSGDTTATADARRTNLVVLPGGTGVKGSQSAGTQGGRFFAGVCASDYPAQTYGQLIEIYKPGSTCLILCQCATPSLGVGRLTCQFGGTLAGYFTSEGYAGQGSAIPLQTPGALVSVSLAGKVLARLEEGQQSGLVEVLVSSAVQVANAVTPMIGGVTHFSTATNAAAATVALAVGTYENQRKRFVIDGTQTTNGIVVTPAGSPLKRDGTTALTSVTGSTAGVKVDFEWSCGQWYLRASSFDTIT